MTRSVSRSSRAPTRNAHPLTNRRGDMYRRRPIVSGQASSARAARQIATRSNTGGPQSLPVRAEIRAWSGGGGGGEALPVVFLVRPADASHVVECERFAILAGHR